MSDFRTYLDDEEEDNNINEDDRKKYEQDYDGYQMLWAFDDPSVVHTADGAFDAACISSSFGGGGFCAGIKYTGTTNRSPEKWAIWVEDAQTFENFVTTDRLAETDDND